MVGAAGIGDVAARLERLRIKLEGLMRLLERQQTVPMPDDVGVGDSGILLEHSRIAGQGIAEGAEEGSASRMLELPAGCSHEAVPVGDLPVREGKGVDHPIACEPVMVGVAGLELGIRPVPEKHARKLSRNLALDRQIGEIVFAADRREIAGEVRIDACRSVHGEPQNNVAYNINLCCTLPAVKPSQPSMPRVLTKAEVTDFRERLCEVAAHLFYARGPQGFTLRELATELGVSPMTPYRYFKDKDAILAAVRARAFNKFSRALEDAYTDPGDAPARASAAGEAYIRFALEDPTSYKLMFDLSQ